MTSSVPQNCACVCAFARACARIFIIEYFIRPSELSARVSAYLVSPSGHVISIHTHKERLFPRENPSFGESLAASALCNQSVSHMHAEEGRGKRWMCTQ